jgi:hypothetical protein
MAGDSGGTDTGEGRQKPEVDKTAVDEDPMCQDNVQKIRNGQRLAKPVISCVTCIVVTPMLILGFILAWYSSKVPHHCNTGLHTIFVVLGVMYITTSICLGCTSGCLATTVVNILVHQTLAAQYKRHDMIDEEEKAKQDTWEEVMRSILALPFSCVAVICVIVMIIFWVYGCIAAFVSNATCGAAPKMFWVFFTLLVVSMCLIGPFLFKLLVDLFFDLFSDKDPEEKLDSQEP